jgi:putative inorganic carbon (hco3(-)) transporter
MQPDCPPIPSRIYAALAQVPRAPATAALIVAVLSTAWPIFGAGHDAQRLMQLAFLAVLGAWIVASGRTNGLFGVARTWGGLPLFTFFLIGCISAAFAFSPRHAFVELGILFMLVVTAAHIAHEFRRSPDSSLMRVLSALGVGCCVYVFAVMSAYAASLAVHIPMTARDISLGFDNYRFLNHVQTIALPLLGLLVLLSRPGSRTSKLWFVTAACWWALLFATGGRGAFMGIVGGCAAAALVMGHPARRFAKLMSVLALAGLAIHIVFFMGIPAMMGMDPFGLFGSLAERSLERPTSGRMELWLRALELIGTNPLLGVGPVHFAYYPLTGALPANPHNFVLQFGSEWGIPATLVLLAMLARGVMSLARLRSAIAASDLAHHTILGAFFATAIAILLDSLVSSLIVMPLSQLMLALFLGMATGWCRAIAGKTAVHAHVDFRVRVLMGSLILLAMLAVSWGVSGQLAVAAGIQDEPARPYYNPRIWNDGKF